MSTSHALVWLDHRRAKVVRIGGETDGELVTLATTCFHGQDRMIGEHTLT